LNHCNIDDLKHCNQFVSTHHEFNRELHGSSL
jgi:hypothetical protein